MQFDATKYLDHLEELNTSEEHKLELISVVARMMEAFVDLAFGTAPEQTCLGSASKECDIGAPTRLDSVPPIKPEFDDAARSDAAGKCSP